MVAKGEPVSQEQIALLASEIKMPLPSRMACRGFYIIGLKELVILW